MIKEILSLPNAVVDSIIQFITEKGISTDPLIKDSIFNLLEEKCTVLYYPQDNEENDGCHVQRLVNAKIENFVYINTHKSIEKQVFTAAHELGHILALDSYLKDACPAYSDIYVENCMNRFAAAILMPRDAFFMQVDEKYKNYCGENNTITLDSLIQFSIYLMDCFLVPFKSVVIRLFEIGLIKKSDAETIMADKNTLESINAYIKNLGFKRLGIRTEKKSIKDFPKLLDDVEKKGIFSKEKLDSIRKQMDILPIRPKDLQRNIKISEPRRSN